MRSRDFGALARRLWPYLPGFVVKAPLMLMPPVRHTLRAICFESHSHEEALFYVWVFFQPLFVPAKHVSFVFGERLRAEPWRANAPNLVPELGATLKREALTFLSPIKTPRDVVQAATALQLPQNPHVQEAIAYGLARAGDVAGAVAALGELTRLLDLTVLWQREMFERGNVLESRLLSDAPGAQRQLDDWEVESARNLGLEGFR